MENYGSTENSGNHTHTAGFYRPARPKKSKLRNLRRFVWKSITTVFLLLALILAAVFIWLPGYLFFGINFIEIIKKQNKKG